MSPTKITTSVPLLVLEKTCPKISERASGLLSYRICMTEDASGVFLTIVHNETAGYFSREYVPLSKVETVIADAMSTATSFPASRLKAAFEGKSINNASFLAAILRNEGLITASPEHPLLNVPGTTVSTWKEGIAALPRTVIAPSASNPTPAHLHAKNEEAPRGETKGKKGRKKSGDQSPDAGPQWRDATSEEGDLLNSGVAQDALPEQSE